MKQIGTVIRVVSDGRADIAFAPRGVCGANCAFCYACTPTSLHTIQVAVSFPVSVGDKVSVETPDRALWGDLFFCLTLPVILFFFTWLLATLLHTRYPALWGAGVFALSLFAAVRRSRKRPVSMRVTPLED